MSKYGGKKHRGQWGWNIILSVFIVYVGLTSYYDVVSNSVTVVLPEHIQSSLADTARTAVPVRNEYVTILHVQHDHHQQQQGKNDHHVADDWLLENRPHGHGNVSERVHGRRAYGMTVHTLLHELGIIGNPSYSKNEILDSWVRDDVWTFSTEFDWPYTAHDAVLELDRVDTIAEIQIDGRLVGRTSSMHRTYRFEVSLDMGKHTFSVTLFPVGTYTEDLEKTLAYPVPHTKHHVRVGHYNLVRKIAADFGWDFAPAFAPSGLLGSIVVVAAAHGSEFVVLEQLVVEQEHVGDRVVLHPAVFISMGNTADRLPLFSNNGEIRVDVRDPSGKIVGSSVSTHVPHCDSYCTDGGVDVRDDVHVECYLKCDGPVITIQHPELWWTWDQSPAGRKEQPLYSVTAVLSRGSGCSHTKTVKIGMRSFELVRKPIGKEEESFYFRINGRMMYSKGSNLVPLDVFQDQIQADHIIHLVWSARRAHFNTIRVWGGGGYLPDVFYEECDKHGILVWQEFMFACAAYPTDARFQVDVASEIHQQSLRIANHPSVALFGFNNENENSFDWFEETAMNSALYSVDYYALFITVVRQTLRRVVPRAVYVDTSPSNGIYREDPIYAKRWGDVMDERYGDVHFYEYATNLLSSDVFPKAKFISEFGILSLPSWRVFSKYIHETDDLRDMLEFRTRRKNGLEELFHQMQYHFFPHMQASALIESIRRDTIGQFIYLSQLQQGLVYRNAAFHWRQDMHPKQTMGFLYWQFQDVGHWAGPSWSGVNSDASWKLLHYFSRDFFAPIAMFVDFTSKGRVHVHVSNHLHGPVQATMTVDSVPYSASEQSESTRQCYLRIQEKRDNSSGYQNACSFSMKSQTEEFLVASISFDHDGPHSPSTVFLPSEAAEASLRPSEVTIENIIFSKNGDMDDACPPTYDGMFLMQVSCSPVPAIYVAFESDLDVHFIDNAVHIFPWASKTVYGCYHSSDRLNEENLKNSIQIFDLQTALGVVMR